jgi:hypothetical protein
MGACDDASVLELLLLQLGGLPLVRPADPNWSVGYLKETATPGEFKGYWYPEQKGFFDLSVRPVVCLASFACVNVGM